MKTVPDTYINEIYSNLAEKLSRALTVAQMFTANDFNPSFFKKGKRLPFCHITKEWIHSRSINSINHGSTHHITLFVCRIYFLKSKADVNNGRLEAFEEKYRHRNQNVVLLKKHINVKRQCIKAAFGGYQLI